MLPQDRLIVALDVDTLDEARRLVELLGGRVGMFKVGLQLYHSVGSEAIDLIHRMGGRVFADFKFHDIPNTAAQASRAVTRRGVAMFNLHAAGGREMLAAAVRASREEAVALGQASPLCLAVTVLTSLDERVLRQEVGITKPLERVVVDWAVLAREAGVDGVVASPWEIEAIRAACGQEFAIVTPGVRPAGSRQDDQRRVMTPAEALRAGATYIVVGRPITAAPDPREAAERLLEEG